MINKPACFFDRDGVLNIDKGFVYKYEDFEWIEGAIDAIKFLKENDYYIFVVTNQSGIARGMYSIEDVNILHQSINTHLMKHGTKIDDFFISPSHPDFKNKFSNLFNLRKPETGMLDLAFKKWKFDKEKSFLLGDKLTDIECAEKFGIKGFLYEDGNLCTFLKSIRQF